MSSLLIVESPTKAKTITKFLGKQFVVLSSFGHIRDLPEKEMGVDTKHNFQPTYVISEDKKSHVAALKSAAKKADAIYLATDEDREGEAIAWHIAEVLDLDPKKAKRIVFHEITKNAIERAVEKPRHIDMHLVDAQQARRVLDRLVGFELSPLLWKKVRMGLSAGRVQSVAVRLVVERERERHAFEKQEYWTIEAHLHAHNEDVVTKLVAHQGKSLDKMDITSADQAQRIVEHISGQDFVVQSVTKKNASKKPPTPLTTSLLQQEAYNRLGMSAKQTMTLAQKLYEHGLITYMRTDSQNLSTEFLSAAQHTLARMFGPDYARGAVTYKTQKKGAQEAHEAIRPTDPERRAQDIHPSSAVDERAIKLYHLIWSRTMASQMPSANALRTTVDFSVTNASATDTYTFRLSGSVIVFPGFLKVWHSSEDVLLPDFQEKERVGQATSILPEQHFTEPPARYSDATLVKILEEYGIGRPSTYAPTISTIVDRGYVLRDDNNRLFPADVAYIVNDLLVEHFSHVVDYTFTAEMEKKFDDIADEGMPWQDVIAHFYTPFHKSILEKSKHLTREDVAKERDLGKNPTTGQRVVVKFGRFGAYAEEGEGDNVRRASLPKNVMLDAATLEDALLALALPRNLGANEAGEAVIAGEGRFGPYIKIGAVYASLPPEIDPRTVSLPDALIAFAESQARKKKALTPIAELGKDPKTGQEITVRDGRYGPYVTNGEINATIGKKTDPKSITLEDALVLLAKKAKSPKRTFRRRKATKT